MVGYAGAWGKRIDPDDDEDVMRMKPRMTFNSTSDKRVENNVMRHEYRTLSDEEKAAMRSFKDMGLEFVQMCDVVGSSRELSLAKTKMEEAVMWAVKHITK